ncbi:MAG: 50S ribosomal protein L22 [Candidatus Zambryskibacteria bacterium]|nr:50S ribosomal protein L22 [Candidatus Zambryskibacteria bacterium]
MVEVAAQLNNYRQSPRKVRLVADAIRGKSVKEARNRLNFITKKTTGPLQKLLNSALANAKNIGIETDNLKIKSITVNKGQTLFRRRPVAHGAAHPIKKRTSKIKLVLSDELKTKS